MAEGSPPPNQNPGSATARTHSTSRLPYFKTYLHPSEHDKEAKYIVCTLNMDRCEKTSYGYIIFLF